VSSDLLRGFHLQELLIEPLKGQVSSAAGSAHLQPKAMDLLVYLARHHSELLTRDELIAHVWGAGGASQEALSHAVGEIRHALGDRAADPHFIQTAPKLGYRLLVAPSALETHSEPASDDVGSDDELPQLWTALMKHGVVQAALAYLFFGWLMIQVADATFETLGLPLWSIPFVTFVVVGGFPLVVFLAWFIEVAGGRIFIDRGRQSGRFFRGLERNYLTIVAAYGIAAIAAGTYQYTVGFSTPTSQADIPEVVATVELPVHPNSIAVLQFLNIDGGETTQIFSDGLGEDVLDHLAALPGILVSSRGDSWSLPPNASSEIVRRRLRVAYFVEGSIRMVGDKIRIVVQLIDSQTGFHILSRNFERELNDYMGVQKEITSLIVANLRIVLPEDTQFPVASTNDDAGVDAYVLYRRGKDLLNQPHTADTLERAIGFFDEALSLDSGYAAAHAGLCQAYVESYDFGSDIRFIDLAESACATALSAAPQLHVVYAALGDLYKQTGRYAMGQAAYEEALEINAQYVPAMHGLSLIYENQKRFDEAEALLVQAIELQPGNWRSMNSLGGFLFASGRYDEAADAYRMIALLDPDNWQGLGNLGSALLMSGDFSEAATALQRSIEIELDQTNLSNLAIIYYYLGRFDQSVAIHRDSVERSPDSDVAWLNLADSLLFSNESERAVPAYQKAAELSQKRLAVDPRDAMTLCRTAWATAMLGDIVRADKLMGRARKIAPNNPYVYYYDALLKTKDGQHQAALDALSIALVNGYPPVMLVAEPLLFDLRETERFSTLVSEPLREGSIELE